MSALDFGERLRAARLGLRMTQAELGAYLLAHLGRGEVSKTKAQGQVSRLECGRGMQSAAEAEAARAVFRVLFGEDLGEVPFIEQAGRPRAAKKRPDARTERVESAYSPRERAALEAEACGRPLGALQRELAMEALAARQARAVRSAALPGAAELRARAASLGNVANGPGGDADVITLPGSGDALAALKEAAARYKTRAKGGVVGTGRSLARGQHDTLSSLSMVAGDETMKNAHPELEPRNGQKQGVSDGY